jgi:hypothetical protein
MKFDNGKAQREGWLMKSMKGGAMERIKGDIYLKLNI